MFLDGSHYEVWIGKVPDHILTAEQEIGGAETLFRLARSYFNSVPENVCFTIRVHGISPRNRPLGSRDLYVDYADLLTLSWIPELRALWPFEAYRSVCHFVNEGDFQSSELRSCPVFHFVLSFVVDPEGCPVLVRQRLQEINTGKRHEELWAAVIPRESNEHSVSLSLNRYPFWFHHGARTHILKYGVYLDRLDDDNHPGQILDLRMYVVSADFMLSALWALENRKEQPIHHDEESDLEMEQVSMLQMGHQPMNRGSTALHEVPTPGAFEEICEAIMNQDATVPKVRAGIFADDPNGKTSSEGSMNLPKADRERQDEECCSILDPVSQESIATLHQYICDLQRDDWQGLNPDFSCIPDLHPMAQAATHTTRPADQVHGIFHVFTDGSAKQGVASWAFVVLTEIGVNGTKGFFRIGFSGGIVDADLGPFEPNALDAEATALIAAVEYLISRKFCPDLKVEMHLHFDSTAAGWGSLGQQNIATNGYCSERQKAARMAMSWLQRKHTVAGFHVHAHEGQPWNECADSVATWVRMGGQCVNPPHLKSGPILQHRLKEWAWMMIRPTKECPSLQEVLQPVQIRSCSTTPDQTFSCEVSNDEGRQISGTLKLASLNVGTLEYRMNAENAPVSHKMQEILYQMDQAKYDFVAIQESRARVEQTCHHGPYLRFISAGQRGQAGVELWCHVNALSAKLGRQINAEDFVIWHSDARLLCVHFQLDRLGVDIIVCYGPQSGRQEHEIREWWTHCDQVIMGREWNAPIWLLGDMNAKVGNVESEAIGGRSPDMEDIAGRAFRELCEKCDLFVPATFQEMHVGESTTFVSRLGFETRVDYIALSCDFWHGVKASYIDDEIDALNGEVDHKVIALELTFCSAAAPHGSFARKPWYDRHDAKQAFKSYDAFANLQEIDWETHTTEHWDVMRDHLQNCMMKRFPCKKRKQRQLYFSHEAWDLVCQRKDVRMHFRALMRHKNWMWLKACFQEWRGRYEISPKPSRYEFFVNACQLAITYEQRSTLDDAFRIQKKRDWKFWVNEQIQQRVQNAARVKDSELFKILKPKAAIAKHTGATRKPLPGLQDAKGKLQFSRTDIALAWQVQFASIENAQPTTVETMRQYDSPGSQLLDVSVFERIPTVYDIERSLRQLSLHKAAGFDGIGPEAFKGHPAEVAQRIYPLILKMALRGEWPAEWSGGWLLPLFKHKGSSRLMAGYRAILLEPCLARVCSRAWRPFLLQGLSRIAAINQWGGRKGMGISALHVQIKMAQQNAVKQKKASALLFLDLKSAFYTIAKPLLSQWEGDSDSLQQLARMLGIPEDAIAAFIEHVGHSDLILKATDNPQAAQMVSASLARTWFVIPNASAICAPKTGSRPGDPVADILFAYVMACILDQVQLRMEVEGLIDEVTDHELLPSQMVTWVDDVAVMITGTAENIADRAIKTFSVIQDIITEYGMTLSMGPGKSAVILNFAGPGAVRARQTCEAQHGAALRVMSEHQGMVKLPIVAHYKHLGGFIVRNGSSLPEIQVRAAQSTARMKPLRHITKDPRIDIVKRRLIVKSMMLPVITLHSGTWSNLNKQEFQAWAGAIFRIYSALNCRESDGHFTPMNFYEVANLMQSPMPLELLHINKLRLLFQMLEHGDEAIFSAVIQNWRIADHDSWLAGALRSMHWLEEQTACHELVTHIGNLQEIQSWRDKRHLVSHMKKALKQAEKAHLLRIRIMCEMKQVDKQQQQAFREMGWDVPFNVQESQEQEDQFPCDECGKIFQTAASRSVHEHKVHGKKAAMRRFLTDGTCRACGNFFHTRARALQHAQYSKQGCWFFHMRWLVPMTEEAANELDVIACEKREAWHHHGLKSHEKDQQWRFATDLEMVPTLQQYRPKQEIEWHLPTEVELQAWRKYGHLPTGQGGQEKTVRKLKEWDVCNVIEDLTTMESQVFHQAEDFKPNWDWVPPPLASNAKFYLLFFSGHRRWGDIACWATWEQEVYPVSIDTAVHEEKGNLHNTGFWIHLIASGLVVGAHGAPPCETYSLARWLKMYNDQGQLIGPRPLRDSKHPWGRPFLTMQEVRQMTAGCLLMAKTLQLLMMVYICGGCFTLEHPKGPCPGDEAWGIFCSGFIKRLKLLPEVTLITFLQGPLGVPYSKPTSILQARLPHLAPALYSAYDPAWKCTEVLGGFCNEQKTWRTNRAKVYPPLLCQILAQQTAWFSRNVKRLGQHVQVTDDDGFLEALAQPWDPYLEDSSKGMLNDFQEAVFHWQFCPSRVPPKNILKERPSWDKFICRRFIGQRLFRWTSKQALQP